MNRIVRFAMIARSFAIQGAWNYRTLIGHGFAFALLPALRSLHRGRPDELDASVVRHTQVFNSHPYLVGVALGAVSEMEVAGTDQRVIDRFKSAVRSSLGSIGDGLVWAAWRPTCALLGLAIVFAGAPWWAGPIVYLVAYNAGTVVLRIWGFHVGFRHGRSVGDLLHKAHLDRVQRDASRAGAFLLGAMLPLLLATGVEHGARWPWVVAGVAAAVLGLRFGNAARTPIIAGAAVVLVAALLIGLRA